MAQAVTRNFGGSWGIPPPLRFRQPRRSPTLAGFRVVWGSGFRGSPHFQSVGFDCVAKKQAHASPRIASQKNDASSGAHRSS